MVLLDSRTRLHQLPCVAAEAGPWRELADSVPLSGRGYEPSDAQREFLEDDHLMTLLAGGVRSGKSDTAAMKAYLMTLGFLGEYAASGKAAGEVAWIVANSYELCAKEFDYLLERLRRSTQFRIRASRRVDPGFIEISVPGGVFTIKTRSASDSQTLRAESPVWILVCEAALLSFDAYWRLMGRVVEARAKFAGYGSICLSGTFEGSLGWYPVLWRKWQAVDEQERENVKSFSMPSHSNRFIFPLGEADPWIQEQKKLLPESVYLEQIEAVPSPPKGRVHQGFDSIRHVRNVTYDPQKTLYAGIDPGYSGRSSTYAVELIQQVDSECGEMHFGVFDEIFEKQLTVEQVITLAASRPWWSNPDKKFVIDTAGAAHAGAQESNEELWMKRAGIVILHQKVNIRPGIDRFDSMLMDCPKCRNPRLVIDPRCVGVLSELGHTQNPFDGQTHVYSWQTDREGNVVGSTPRDEYCDGIKALTYFFVNELGYAHASGARRRVRVKRQRPR